MGYERKEIPDDEPVIVLRAQDALAVDALDYYRRRCQQEGADGSHVEAVARMISRFSAWQSAHATKLPDTRPGEYQ